MLTPRLEAIAEMVIEVESLADIGTDHGYLPIALLQSGGVQKAIAADVNEKPLASAQKNTPTALAGKMQFRLGNGLEPIGIGEVDLAVIAGMGGELIGDILSADWKKTRSIKTFILQPMVKVSHLRNFLKENQFRIIDETMVQEGKKYYQIIKVVHGDEEPLEPIHMELGKGIIEKGGEALLSFLAFRIQRIDRILNQLKQCEEGKEREIEIWEMKRQELMEVKANVGKRNHWQD